MNDKEVMKQAVIDIKKGLNSILNGIEDSSNYKIEAGFYAIRESIKSLDEELGLKDDIQRIFNNIESIESKLDLFVKALLKAENCIYNSYEHVWDIKRGIKK